MNFSNLRYFIYGIIATLSLSSIIVSAGTEDGVFGDYFTNIITNGCADKSVVTGFDTSSATYGKTKCSTIQSLLGSLFASSSSPSPGQAVTGFNSDGTLKYGDVNYWNKASGNISYTGGNVGIGTNVPTSKLTVTGGGIGGQYAITPGYVNWAQFSTGNGGAAIYNDNGSYKKLMIIGNNSAGGAREVGIWDNLNVAGNITTNNLNVNDIYLRSAGKWASSMGSSSYSCKTGYYLKTWLITESNGNLGIGLGDWNAANQYCINQGYSGRGNAIYFQNGSWIMIWDCYKWETISVCGY